MTCYILYKKWHKAALPHMLLLYANPDQDWAVRSYMLNWLYTWLYQSMCFYCSRSLQIRSYAVWREKRFIYTRRIIFCSSRLRDIAMWTPFWRALSYAFTGTSCTSGTWCARGTETRWIFYFSFGEATLTVDLTNRSGFIVSDPRLSNRFYYFKILTRRCNRYSQAKGKSFVSGHCNRNELYFTTKQSYLCSRVRAPMTELQTVLTGEDLLLYRYNFEIGAYGWSCQGSWVYIHIQLVWPSKRRCGRLEVETFIIMCSCNKRLQFRTVLY